MPEGSLLLAYRVVRDAAVLMARCVVPEGPVLLASVGSPAPLQPAECLPPEQWVTGEKRSLAQHSGR